MVQGIHLTVSVMGPSSLWLPLIGSRSNCTEHRLSVSPFILETIFQYLAFQARGRSVSSAKVKKFVRTATNWMFVSRQNHYVKTLTSKEVWEGWGLWEVCRLWGWITNGINVFRKASSLGPSHIQGTQEQVAISEAGSGPSPDTESAGALMLDTLTSKGMRNKRLLFKSHPLYGILF